jgi:hypothetical protein
VRRYISLLIIVCGVGFVASQAASAELPITLQKSELLMAKCYRHPAGKFLAAMVVNTTGTPQATTLRPVADFASKAIRHYTLDGRTETAKPSSEIRLELPAFDVQVLAFESP